jgi:hypothetical protein
MSKFAKLVDRVPVAPSVALMFGGVAAILVLATPVDLLERAVEVTRLPDVLSAAQAPLGVKARILLGLMAAGAVALPCYFVLRLLTRRTVKPKSFRAEKAKKDKDAIKPFSPPVVEEEAPTGEFGMSRRRPIFAREDLGEPFMADLPTAVPTPRALSEPVVLAEPETGGTAHAFVLPDQEMPTADFAARDLKVPVVEAPLIEVPSAVEYAPALESEGTEPGGDELVLHLHQVADIPAEDPIAQTEEGVSGAWIVPEPVSVPLAPPVVDAALPASLEPSTPVWEEPVHAQNHAADVPPEPSIEELLTRFESGVRRRQLASLVMPASVSTGTTNAAADAALRDALGTLERLAANVR